MPDLAAPATPAAPVASAPAAVAPAVTPAPAPPAAVTPAPVATPSVPAVAAKPAKYDPQTATAPPKQADYPDTLAGIDAFTTDNSSYLLQHPEDASRIHADRLSADDQLSAEVEQPAEAIAEAAKTVDGTEPEAAKPAEAVAATPAAVEEWTAKSPDLKAAFEKNPELRTAVMEMARQNEAAKPVLDIVGTAEEAQFAVEHANRLVGLQSSWMLSGEDPDMVQPAWDQTVEMFKERDAEGNEIKGLDGQAKLGADFQPFVRKAASSALEGLATTAQSRIAAIEARLAGSYPSEEARAADAESLEDAKYGKAALDFTLQQLLHPDGGTKLPALPPDATPEQVAFQKKLEEQQKEFDAKTGKATTESRKAATKAIDREVQTSYETGINRFIDTNIAAMKERGEYLPDFVLNDKWINPTTGQPTKVSAFGARIYLALNAKINNNPSHAAKLGSLQALGAAGKDARMAELSRLQTLYLPTIFQAEVTRIQDGIRASSSQPKPAATVARLEPQSQTTVMPSGQSDDQLRTTAEAEAKNVPGFSGMSAADKEATILALYSKRKYFGT